MYYNNYYSPFHFFLGPIFMIAVWVLIIWGIISLVRHFSGSCHSNNKNESAADILKERYVKGEITREQFESMKKDIK